MTATGSEPIPVIEMEAGPGFWPREGAREIGTIDASIEEIATALSAPVFVEGYEAGFFLYHRKLGGWVISCMWHGYEEAGATAEDRARAYRTLSFMCSILVQPSIDVAKAKTVVTQVLSGVGNLRLYP